MKFTIDYSYKGRKFNDLEDAVAAAIMDGYYKIIQPKLAPYADEIQQSGGRISINFIDDNYNADVIFHDIPSELASKLKQALAE